MKIQQLFYTSCKKGLSSGAGFQTYSMSKGISEDERLEIENYCVYVPPKDVPTQPSKEEIDKLFPIAFSYFILSNGKYCICQSKYIGKDYSERYGNYFCHVLVFDKVPSFYPIEMYKSITFRDKLTYEEESQLEIKYLPELEEVHLGNFVDFDSISEFLKSSQVSNKSKKFKNLIDAVMQFSDGGKRIVFSDSKESSPYLIGAIQMSLPKKLANQITFSTYCYNPEGRNYIIAATDEYVIESNLKLNGGMYKYNLFNFTHDEISKLNYNSSFVKLAEIGFTISKEIFLPFINFISQFDYEILDKNIDSCVCLYNMVKKGIKKTDIESVKKAVNFAIKYKSIEGYNELFKELKPNLEKISTQVDVELAEIITKFLIKMGRETGEDEHIQNAYSFFFHSIHYLVVDAENIEEVDILKLYDNIRNLNTMNINEFVKNSLSTSRIKELTTYIEGSKVRHAKFYFKSIVYDVLDFNNQCKENEVIKLFSIESERNKCIAIFLYKALGIIIKSTEDALDIFNSFKSEYEFLAKIINSIYSFCENKDTELKEGLISFIVKEGFKDKQWKNKMYSYLSSEDNGFEVLLNIYEFQLANRKSREEFFIDYAINVFNIFSEYRNEKFWQSLDLYLNYCRNDDRLTDNISVEEYKKIFNYIIDNLLSGSINKDILKKALVMFENKIDMDDTKSYGTIIEKLFNIKKKYNIYTENNVIEILYIGEEIDNGGLKLSSKILENSKFRFDEMDEYRYKIYLKWFLSKACVHTNSYNDHGRLKSILYCQKYSNIYYNEYVDIIEDMILGKKYKDKLKECNKEGYEIFLDFVIFVFKNIDDMDKKSEIIIADRVLDILKRIPEKKQKLYSVYILEKTKHVRNKKQIIFNWERVVKIASKDKKTFLSFFRDK